MRALGKQQHRVWAPLFALALAGVVGTAAASAMPTNPSLDHAPLRLPGQRPDVLDVLGASDTAAAHVGCRDAAVDVRA